MLDGIILSSSFYPPFPLSFLLPFSSLISFSHSRRLPYLSNAFSHFYSMLYAALSTRDNSSVAQGKALRSKTAQKASTKQRLKLHFWSVTGISRRTASFADTATAAPKRRHDELFFERAHSFEVRWRRRKLLSHYLRSLSSTQKGRRGELGKLRLRRALNEVVFSGTSCLSHCFISPFQPRSIWQGIEFFLFLSLNPGYLCNSIFVSIGSAIFIRVFSASLARPLSLERKGLRSWRWRFVERTASKHKYRFPTM